MARLDLATYLGGLGEDGFEAEIKVDTRGYIYIAGKTASSDFPTRRALDGTANGGKDAFVAKLDPDGNLAFSTFLGGSGDDMAKSLFVDDAGNIFVAGRTTSTDFPTTAGVVQPACAVGVLSCSDAFVAKLSPDGSALVFSTYLGGAGSDRHDVAEGLWVGDDGSLYVTGYTQSTDFPTKSALQAQCTPGVGASVCYDMFVTKLDSDAANLIYSTFLGGSGDDTGRSIVVDATGNAWVGGSTTSPDFPTVAALQPSLAGDSDGLLLKLAASGASLAHSTYLGGGSTDVVNGVAIDPLGDIFVTGATSSSDFPTASALQPNHGGVEDAFVGKVDGSSGAILFSTYLGGGHVDKANDLAVDAIGDVYVTGRTKSADFPTAMPMQGSLRGAKNAFVSVIEGSGAGLITSTYFGGTGPTGDVAYGIAVDRSGAAHVLMQTDSPDLPLIHAVQPVLGGALDTYLFRLATPLRLWLAATEGDGPLTSRRSARGYFGRNSIPGPSSTSDMRFQMSRAIFQVPRSLRQIRR